jgi:uncharacterized coiled-coil DUF342 family protein
MNVEKLDKLEKKINQILALVSDLKEDKEELSARNNELEAKVEKLSEENRGLKAKLTQAETTLDETTKKHAKLEAENKTLSTKQVTQEAEQKMESLMKKLDSIEI